MATEVTEVSLTSEIVEITDPVPVPQFSFFDNGPETPEVELLLLCLLFRLFSMLTLLSVVGDLDIDNVLFVSLLYDAEEVSTLFEELIETGFEVSDDP